MRSRMRLWTRLAKLGAAGLFGGIASADAAEWRLSTAGYGPARIGMSVEEAARALHVDLVAPDPIDEPECYYVEPKPKIDGLAIMVSQGRVVRFDVGAPGIKSRSGLGVGDAEAHVLEVLGVSSVEVTPHKYTGPEGHYLTIWSNDHSRALRFETDQGKVTAFHAGRVPEATYVEGCS